MYISREINGALQGWSSTYNIHQSIFLPNIYRVTIVLKDNFETICVDLNTTIPVLALGNFLLIHLAWQIQDLRSWNQGFELNYTKYTNQVYENNIWNKWVLDSLTLGIDFQESKKTILHCSENYSQHGRSPCKLSPSSSCQLPSPPWRHLKTWGQITKK